MPSKTRITAILDTNRGMAPMTTREHLEHLRKNGITQETPYGKEIRCLLQHQAQASDEFWVAFRVQFSEDIEYLGELRLSDEDKETKLGIGYSMYDRYSNTFLGLEAHLQKKRRFTRECLETYRSLVHLAFLRYVKAVDADEFETSNVLNILGHSLPKRGRAVDAGYAGRESLQFKKAAGELKSLVRRELPLKRTRHD